MATFTPVIIKHHKKIDGTWNAKIRISQKGKSAYIDTSVNITKSDIDSRFKIKRNVIAEKFSDILREYYNALTPQLNDHGDAQLIKRKLREIKSASKVEFIDFLEVCEKIIQETVEFSSKNSAIPLRTVTNSLRDFTAKLNGGKAATLSPTEITSQFLKDYEKYLRTTRHLVRTNQFGKPVVTKSAPLSDAGVFKHMANLRLLFNACKAHYNDEDTGKIVIPNNPFAKYKIASVRKNVKRSLTIVELVKLYQAEPLSPREVLAKDMFFLSFFLCGMNSVDIYNYNQAMKIVNGRLSYNRSKTMGRRSDSALISIKVTEIIGHIIDKYAGKIYRRFSDGRTFNKSLNIGLGSLSKRAGLGNLTFYFARHTFATIARNDCKCSKDDIAEALNHVDTNLRVTDNYIAKDWKIVDDVQEKVLKFFFDKVDELGQFALNAQ